MERIAALISQEAYKAPSARLQNIGLWIYDESLSSDEAAVYANNTQVLIGFRGTTMNVSDASLLLGFLTGNAKQNAQLERNKLLVKAIKDKHNKKVILTGHSKGAWLATKIAQENDEVIGFSPGTGWADIIQSWKPTKGIQPKIVYHSVRGDVLSIPSYFLHGVETQMSNPSAKQLLYAILEKSVLPFHSLNNFT